MRGSSYRWVILSTGFTVLFFSGGSRHLVGLMLKPMSDDLGWSRSEISLAPSIFMVVSALAAPLVGRLTDRYGYRWVISVSAVALSVGIGLVGSVHALWQIFLLYGLVYAVGNAGTSITPVGVMITRWFTGRRGIASSAATSGMATGQLVIIAVLVSLLTSLGWRGSFVLVGVVNLVVVVPLVLATAKPGPATRAPQPPEPPGPPGAPVASRSERGFVDYSPPLSAILASGQLWVLVLVYAICGFQDFFVITHVVAFATDQGMGSVMAGNMLAIMGLMGLMGVLSAGILADAFGAARPTSLCFLLRIGVFSLVILSKHTAAIVVFALVYGFTNPITAPLIVLFAGSIFGVTRLGMVSGMISMVHSATGGLGALVGAAVFDRTGSYDAAFVLMLALSVLSMAMTLLIRERPIAAATAPG